MVTVNDLLWGVALPCGVALVLTASLGGWRWGAALALAAGYMAGHIALEGVPGAVGVEGERPLDGLSGLLPHGPAGWALVAAAAALMVGLSVSCSCVSSGAVGLGRLLLAFGIVNAVLWPIVEQHWDKVQALVHIQAILGVTLVIWWSIDGLAERVRGAAVPLVLLLTTAGVAALSWLHGSRQFGQLAAAMSAALLGAFLAGLFRRSMDVSRGGVAVVMAVTATLLLAAVFYGGTPLWAGLTVALTPTLAWVLRCPPIARMRGAAATPLAAVLVLLPVLAAVAPRAIAMIRGGSPVEP